MYTIISGTNRPGSNTIKVAIQYQYLLKRKGIDAVLLSLEGLDVSGKSSSLLDAEKNKLIPAEKFVFVMPEYNGSFPGVLKSLLDNSDVDKTWLGKKALLTGVSTGRAGNLRGMEHLTGILHYMKVQVHPNKLPISIVDKLIDPSGKITNPATLEAIDEQLNEFIAF